MLKFGQVIIVFVVTSCVVFSSAQIRAADGPGAFIKGLFSPAGEKVSADPKADYSLDETNGPWMIYVKCYDGPNAREDARTLALELRQKHNLKAYVFHRKPDFTEQLAEEERNRKIELEFRQTLAQTGLEDIPLYMPPPVRKVTKQDNWNSSLEYAVLVGDFQYPNDKDINKAFEKIKNLSPECIIAQINRDVAEANQTGIVSRTRAIELQVAGIREEYKTKVAPLAKAQKCPNPILPTEYFNNQVDEFVVKLNENSRYSLLRCPGKWTIKVAEFGGAVISNAKDIEEVEKNPNKFQPSDQLDRAGEKAENLCEALRLKGYVAFTYHDRTKSIVTVGSYNSLGQTDQNGNVTEFHPEIAGIFSTFTWNPKLVPEPGGRKFRVEQAVRPLASDEPLQAGNTIMNIPLLPVPEPMEVPRTFANYNRR